MDITFNPMDALEAAVLRAAAASGIEAGQFEAQIRPADPRFGDYQANGVLPYAKRNGINPRPVASALVEAMASDPQLNRDWLSWSIAGPGFINFTLSAEYNLQWLKAFASEAELRKGASSMGAGAKTTVVIDFSSPNTAKEMHVGHIRSTVIGDCLARLLRFTGATVIRDNHLGDWGTQFGMLIWAIKNTGFDLATTDPASAVAALESLYKEGNAAYQSSAEIAAAVRRELLLLQSGDPANVAIWEAISRVSWEAFQAIYAQLDVEFDLVLGESFYRDRLDAVYRSLTQHGIATESEGALVVFHPDHPRFATQPFIVRKADGASNYATTDLATVWYRAEELQAGRILYVVDSRQADHFAQLFLTAEKWFAVCGKALPRMEHVSFGSVLGEDGKPIKTKSGGSIKLRELLDEAVSRSRAVVQEKNPDLPAAVLDQIARCVGIGAIRYADLSQNRSSDYLFAWDKMLSFEGNTAPYLLYAGARIHSIFRKADLPPDAGFAAASAFETPAECALARKLLNFPGVLQTVLADLRPHVLCTYLFELAGQFSSFYNADKVIVDDPAVRDRRLLLCQRTRVILESGLHLLGLQTLERM